MIQCRKSYAAHHFWVPNSSNQNISNNLYTKKNVVIIKTLKTFPLKTNFPSISVPLENFLASKHFHFLSPKKINKNLPQKCAHYVFAIQLFIDYLYISPSVHSNRIGKKYSFIIKFYCTCLVYVFAVLFTCILSSQLELVPQIHITINI